MNTNIPETALLIPSDFVIIGGNKPDAVNELDGVTKPDAVTEPDSVTKPDAVNELDGVNKPDAATEPDSVTTHIQAVPSAKSQSVHVPDGTNLLDSVNELDGVMNELLSSHHRHADNEHHMQLGSSLRAPTPHPLSEFDHVTYDRLVPTHHQPPAFTDRLTHQNLLRHHQRFVNVENEGPDTTGEFRTVIPIVRKREPTALTQPANCGPAGTLAQKKKRKNKSNF